VLDADQLEDLIDRHFKRDLFRLETLRSGQDRDVPDSGQRTRDYFAGEPTPPPGAWLDVIRREVAEGRYTRRVLEVPNPLTDTDRAQLEWGYFNNADAGERIRVVEAGNGLDLGSRDFWLVEDQMVIEMFYDGAFVGATPVDEPGEVERFRALARRAWDAGTDLTDWWEQHPEYWRDSVPTPRSESDRRTPNATAARRKTQAAS
jgi:hypothetical protein